MRGTVRPARSPGNGAVLVTGGAGFVGTNLSHRLLSSGRRVFVFDNLSRPGVERNLRWLHETDAAWDVAGTIVEFSLDASAARAFVESCRARTGDARLAERLPFYHAAYLAYRLGYCTLAADTVDGAEERARFDALRDRYAGDLAEALEVGGARSAVA